MGQNGARAFVLFLVVGILGLAPQAPAAAQGTWVPTTANGVPAARASHVAVWTGTRMIIWGGTSGFGAQGGLYDPVANSWAATSTTGVPVITGTQTAVWTGTKMIVWGGSSGGVNSTAGLYDPATNQWSAISSTGAPAARERHTAVWTGTKMIVWGGVDGANPLGTGGAYDPATNTWSAVATAGAPAARYWHAAAWTGTRMIVWGGRPAGAGFPVTNTGGVYDPATNSWSATSTTGAPTGRVFPTAVWARSKMVVWGGNDGGYADTGGVYDPATNAWSATATSGAPSGRQNHTAVWTGHRMVVWGGAGSSLVTTNTGGAYDPVANTWTATAQTGAPIARFLHTAVWTGSQMIVWGGRESGSTTIVTSTGGILTDPDVLAPPTDFYTVTPCRVVDTRNPAGPTGGPVLGGNATRSFPVTGGACGIPSAALAVSVNLTAVEASATGYLTLFPGDGAGPPLASALNFSAAQTRANNAVIPLATDGTGTIRVKNGSAGPVHFVLDVNGYFR
jgi:N-acetylneuraminic acid mutarotase